jgi:hypothetical protein
MSQEFPHIFPNLGLETLDFPLTRAVQIEPRLWPASLENGTFLKSGERLWAETLFSEVTVDSGSLLLCPQNRT